MSDAGHRSETCAREEQGHFITGYVIMPNHLHATIAFSETGKDINKIIGDGKRFIGYELINQLKEKNETAILVLLVGVLTNQLFKFYFGWWGHQPIRNRPCLLSIAHCLLPPSFAAKGRILHCTP